MNRREKEENAASKSKYYADYLERKKQTVTVDMPSRQTNKANPYASMPQNSFELKNFMLSKEREKEADQKTRIDRATAAATQPAQSKETIQKNTTSSDYKVKDLENRYQKAREAEAFLTENYAFQTSGKYKNYQNRLKYYLGDYKSIGDLNNALKNAKREKEKADSELKKLNFNENLENQYSEIQSSADFDALANKGSATLPQYASLTDVRDMTDAEVAALYINSDDATRRNIRGIYDYAGLLDNYNYLGTQQKKTYNAIRASKGEEAGYQYLSIKIKSDFGFTGNFAPRLCCTPSAYSQYASIARLVGKQISRVKLRRTEMPQNR